MSHTDLSFFETLPDSALIREKLIIGREIKNKVNIPPLVPVSRSTWRRWIKAGSAPKPVNLSGGVVAWRVGDLREWLASQASNTKPLNSN